jgi:hypothetical protein
MMRVLRLTAMAGLTALCMLAPADAQQPIKQGDILVGTLRLVRTLHPNGTKIEAYQVVSAPRAMPVNDEFCDTTKGVTTFHLFTTSEVARKRLKPYIGKAITVKTDALFCSQTAWHIGDVAVPEWSLAGKH